MGGIEGIEFEEAIAGHIESLLEHKFYGRELVENVGVFCPLSDRDFILTSSSVSNISAWFEKQLVPLVCRTK